MAITICSSSSSTTTHTPTLPNISLSSLSTKPSLKSPHHFQPTSKSPSNLAADGALTVAEASNLVGAAVDSAVPAYEIENGLVLRRRKRMRKRRKELGVSETEDECFGSGDGVLLFKAANSRKYLTPKEEAEYALYIQEEERLESVRRRIKETSEHEPTSSEWAEAVGMKSTSLEKALCNGRESRERIFQCYKRLIVSVVSSYQIKGLTFEDLVQEGSIGLLRGAKKFNPGRGYKMSTYVYWWIRQAVSKAIANKSRIIRLPGSICEMIPKITEANKILSRRLQRDPSYDEIAQFMNINVATVGLVYERTRPPISMEQPTTDFIGLQEIIPGPDERRPETMVMRQQLKQELANFINITLCEREAYILRLRYGLDGGTPQSFDEIGRLLNLSRERVRQINRLALSKLRQSRMVDNFKVYI